VLNTDTNHYLENVMTRLGLSKKNIQELINDTAVAYRDNNVSFKLNKLRDSIAMAISGRKWSSWLSDWDENTYRYYSIKESALNALPNKDLFFEEARRFSSDTDNALKEMTIVHVITADYSDDGSDIEVKAISNDKTQIFYVQLTDGEHRVDLGCWLLAEGDDGDINPDDYLDFDLPLIIDIAKRFYGSITEELATEYQVDGEYVYLLVGENEVKIVTKNPRFINSATSSYQREFREPLYTFETKDEAFSFLRQL
jgi:hypothetical protein